MFDTDRFTYSEYARDVQKHRRISERLSNQLKRGYLSNNDLKKLHKLYIKLMTHNYDTYCTIVPIV